MKLVRFAALGVAAILLSVGAIACGDDDDGDGDGNTPEPAATSPAAATSDAGGEATATTEAEETQPAGSVSISVTAADFSFTPASLEAAAGEVTLTLTNSGAAPHTLAVYEDDTFATQIAGADTGQVAGGAEGTFTAAMEAGDYAFRCNIHPAQMQGTLTVQ